MFDFKSFLRRNKIKLERNIAGILKDGVESHYTLRQKPKKSGGYRTIWEPDKALWAYQRMILEIILYRVAPSPIAHGGVPGHSIATCLAPMLNARSIFHVDLANAFESVSFGRTLGLRTDLAHESRYAWIKGFDIRVPVMEAILALCEVRAKSKEGYSSSSFLPQGAPTSQHLFNLALYPEHWRVERLAKNRGCDVVQYGDDWFLFSTQPCIPPETRRAFVRIIERYGWLKVNPKKTYYLEGANGANNPSRALGANIIEQTARLRPKHLRRLRMKIYCAEQAGDEATIAGIQGFVAQIYEGERWPSQLASIKPADWDERGSRPIKHSALAHSVNIGDIFNRGIITKSQPASVMAENYPLRLRRKRQGEWVSDDVFLPETDNDFVGQLVETAMAEALLVSEHDSFSPPLYDAWGNPIEIFDSDDYPDLPDSNDWSEEQGEAAEQFVQKLLERQRDS